MVEHLLAKQKVAGSSPAVRSKGKGKVIPVVTNPEFAIFKCEQCGRLDRIEVKPPSTFHANEISHDCGRCKIPMKPSGEGKFSIRNADVPPAKTKADVKQETLDEIKSRIMLYYNTKSRPDDPYDGLDGFMTCYSIIEDYERGELAWPTRVDNNS